MSAQQTSNKPKIPKKLLIPEVSHHLRSNSNNLASHDSSSHNLQIGNKNSTQRRPSKSHSLYNVKDFLPTQCNDLNSQYSKNSVNRTQTQPNTQNNSNIFFLKTVFDHSEQSFLKQRVIKNQSIVQQMKKKDFKIDDLEAQVNKLKFDKLQAQKRYFRAENQIYKTQKQYKKLRQQFEALQDCLKQSKEQLLNLKKKQENRKRQIKFWSRKMHIDIQPRNIQKYSISSQTESIGYNNYPVNDNKRAVFSISLVPPEYSNQNSQKTRQQTSQQNFNTNKNCNEEFHLRSRRNSEYQINQLNRASTTRFESKKNTDLIKLPFLNNLNKQNDERRSNFNIQLPSWQKKNIAQKGWTHKIKDEAIQIYPVDQRQVQSIIKSLLQ